MTVHVKLVASCMVLTIDRPEVRNALDQVTTSALADGLAQADADDRVGAIVLTGAGERAFCAGIDLKAVTALLETDPQQVEVLRMTLDRVIAGDVVKPLIAAVNGLALGGGFELVLACDFAVAAEHCTFGLPEVTRGRVAGAGGAVRLAKRVGVARALEMTMTGTPIDAGEAWRLGLVNHVVPSAEVVPMAVAIAERIAANAPVAVRATKRLIKNVVDLPEGHAIRLSHQVARDVGMTPDATEGVRAFAEGRPPRWAGVAG